MNRRNALWSFLANVAYAFSQWALLVVLARLSDPYTLGTFSLALTIAAPVFMAMNMRLRFVQSADFSNRWAFTDFLHVRVATSWIAILACACLSLMWWDLKSVMFVLFAVAVFKAMEAVQDICIGAGQKHGRMRPAAISIAIAGAGAVAVFGTIFGVTGSLVLATFALALVRFMALLAVDLPIAIRITNVPWASLFGSRVGTHGRGDGWKTLVASAWPLGIVAALDSLNAGVPRYFLASFSGNSELGIYTAMAHVALAGFVAVNAIGQSMSPSMAVCFGLGNIALYKKMVGRLLGIAAAVGLFGIVGVFFMGDLIVAILYGDGFQVVTRDFVLVMVAGAMSYVSLAAVFALSSAQRLGVQAWIYGASFLCVFIISAFLIPRWGISGAAVALVVAHALQVMISMSVISRSLERV